LGLDIRLDEFRYVCLGHDKYGFVLLHQDRDKYQPRDEGFLQMTEALQRSLEGRKIRPGRIVVSIPRQWLFIKTITLPIMAEENVGQALSFELEKHLPVDPSTLIYDHTILTGRPGKEMTVLVGAVRGDRVGSILSALKTKGLEPEAIVPTPFANEALTELCRPGASQEPRTLLVDEDSRAVGVDLFEHGQLSTSQAFSLEGRHEPEALDKLEKDLFRGLTSILGDFESLGAFPWFLFGPTDGMASRALQALGLTYPTFIGYKSAVRTTEEVDMALFHTAVGLALYGHKDEPAPINLLPRPSEASPAPRRIPGRAVLLGAVLLTALGLYGAVNIRDIWELSRLKEAVGTLRPQVEEVNRLQGELSQLKAQSEAVEALVARDPSALEVIRELTLVVPSSAWLTESNYTGRELLIGGYALSSEELIGLLEESPLFANIEFRGTITKRDGKERFRIAAEIE
jgi:Tfp pilus assembly protein PilN